VAGPTETLGGLTAVYSVIFTDATVQGSDKPGENTRFVYIRLKSAIGDDDLVLALFITGNFQKLRITSSSIDSGMENAFIYCDA
jgi:hypothetical protein